MEDNKFIRQGVAAGVFYDAVMNRPAGQTKREAILIAAEKFDPINVEDFKSRFTDKYEAAKWLETNIHSLTSEQIHEKLQNCQPIDEENMTVLWDNLYYYRILQQIPVYEKTINRLLVVQHMLANLNKKTDYLQLINSTVILPERIFKEDYMELL